MKITQNVAFEFLNFGIFTIFCPFKTDLSGNTVWPQASVFQKLAKIGPFLALFNELLSTQNVNVARFARNVEWDFFCDFQTSWKGDTTIQDTTYRLSDINGEWILQEEALQVPRNYVSAMVIPDGIFNCDKSSTKHDELWITL